MQSFVSTVPGLGPLVAREARRLGLSPRHITTDGRADLVSFNVAPPRLRTAEAAFVAVHDVRTIARPVRLVVRVQDESRFTRRDLRRRYERRLGRLATDRETAPELWVLQTRSGHIWHGLRVRASRPRRAVELPGALRPAVAAAMLELVAVPGLVVDPCCGTGTIPLAAEQAVAGDLHVDAARSNGTSLLVRADAQRVPLRTNCAAAVVTNLPFGRQHVVQGSPVAWYRRVLNEALRVAPQAVLLAAATTPFRQALGRLDAELAARYDIELLGNRTVIWDVRRGRPGRAATSGIPSRGSR
ncbi:MAG: tRNA (guanine6-N2)-methyltransferase [Actinomycetota bacterium]